MKYVYIFENYMYPEVKEYYREGDEVLVYSRVNNNTGSETFGISKEYAREGYPGNINANIRRFHGWRGETNNVSTYAHGVYTVKAVEVKAGKYAADQYIKVILNRTDIKKGKE